MSGISIGGMTQNDIGNAAMRVGGSMFSGMKALGGLAYNAAKSKAMGDSSPPSAPASPTAVRTGGLSNLFFSKSAPPASSASHTRRQSLSSPRRSLGDGGVLPSPAGPASMINSVLTALPTFTNTTGLVAGAGSYVTVVDLMPLLNGAAQSAPAQPEKIAEFLTFKSQPISELSFSSDGTSLLVVPRDGQTCKVFSIRPTPKAMRRVLGVDVVQHQPRSQVDAKRSKNTSGSGPSYAEELRSLSQAGLHADEELPWHLYDLKRGRTSAVIEKVDWADDGRWIAIGSRKRTVHVFAVNSYGGKADEASHMEGKARSYLDTVRYKATAALL